MWLTGKENERNWNFREFMLNPSISLVNSCDILVLMRI
jgi:hypothetical protein